MGGWLVHGPDRSHSGGAHPQALGRILRSHAAQSEHRNRASEPAGLAQHRKTSARELFGAALPVLDHLSKHGREQNAVCSVLAGLFHLPQSVARNADIGLFPGKLKNISHVARP